MQKTLPIIVITGATASGKTSLSIELAKQIDAEIICADSRIVYKDFNIVSAKPDNKEKEGIKHHLIDIISPDEGQYSAGDFIRDSKKIIDSARKTGKNIIIQGGSWFYIKSLLDDKNLVHIPSNPAFRESLKNYSNEQLHQMLKAKDEKRASLVHQNNRDKVIRSLELIEGLGGKLSEFEREDNEKYNAKWFMIDIERENLYERINKRVDLMIKNGLYEEWQKNKQKYPNNDILLNTIGYREFFDLESGVYKDFSEAVEKIKQHTRNFAKRQLTFFRVNEQRFKIKKVSCLQDVTMYF